MKIQLDHIQRLSLHTLLGAQRGDLATIRVLWALQDKLALKPDEENAIELRREIIAGQERMVWNPELSLPLKDFEVTDAEAARIKAAIEIWRSYAVSADRRWLEPLVTAFLPTEPQPVGA